ncbi:MAG: MarR family transcriptional regulator [Woeseia sp.]
MNPSKQKRKPVEKKDEGKGRNTIPAVYDPDSPQFYLFGSPFYLIAHADFEFHADLDKVLAKYGTDRTTYRLLTVLRTKNPANIKELAEYALMKRSTVSRSVERMRSESWVVTAPNLQDSRLTDVTLTDAGLQKAQRVMQLGSRQLHRAMEGVSEEEIRVFVGLLQRIVANLSKLPIE